MAISSVNLSNTCHLGVPAPTSSSSSQATFDKAFEGMPRDQWHFLFMDRNKWKSSEPVPEVDARFFDEPGYLAALSNTFENVIRNSLGERFNSDKFCQLHDSCVDGVFHDDEMTKPFKKGYEKGYRYEFAWKDISDETVDELHNEKVLCFLEKYSNHRIGMKAVENFEFLSFTGPSPQCTERCAIESCFKKETQLPLVHAKINALFDQYYASIESSRSDDDKLEAIVNLCRTLHIFHVFPDGNGRTILFALLPKLLIENGFSPAIVDNPSRMFTGYHSTKEMVVLLKQGMKNYQRVVEQLNPLR